MNESERVAEAIRWMRYARGDLELAGELAPDAARARHTCWLSQQAAEKALKAALVLEGIEFPYIHDLRRLGGLLPAGWPEVAAPASLNRLTEWGAESRYPGDWPEPGAEDAVRAEAEARAVYDSIASELGRRGVAVE